MNIMFKSPKRADEEEKQVGVYDYYASYSHSFVRDFLLRLNLPKNSVVLDPWNGSGSTTYIASMEGYKAIGVDLNPVMKIISISKLANRKEISLAITRCKFLRKEITKKYISPNDCLLLWFKEETANYIRYIDSYLFAHKKIMPNTKIDKVDAVQSIIYLALFQIVRKHLTKFIPSNPTWIKTRVNEKDKISISSEVIKDLLISSLKEKFILTDESNDLLSSPRATLIHATATKLPLEKTSIDVIITSPPYCTRLDYGIATFPELAVFLGDDPEKVDSIRRSLTGRTTIDKRTPFHNIDIGNSGNIFLELVKTHESTSSLNYYYKNYCQYFSEISSTIKEISRVLRRGGVFGCVVQDSFYKDIYCDLSQIIIDMACYFDLNLISRQDLLSKNNMANINKYSKKYRKKIVATESILLFKKGVYDEIT